MLNLFKLLLMMLLAMFLSADAMAAATDFTTAMPTSLLPAGFWDLVLLVMGVIVSISGVVIAIKLVKRARG